MQSVQVPTYLLWNDTFLPILWNKPYIWLDSNRRLRTTQQPVLATISAQPVLRTLRENHPRKLSTIEQDEYCTKLSRMLVWPWHATSLLMAQTFMFVCTLGDHGSSCPILVIERSAERGAKFFLINRQTWFWATGHFFQIYIYLKFCTCIHQSVFFHK